MASRRPLDYRLRCVTDSKVPPCQSYQQATFPPNGPVGLLPFTAYIGPNGYTVPITGNTNVPPGLSLDIVDNGTFPLTWTAIREPSTPAPVYATLVEQAKTTTSPLTLGPASGQNYYIETLPEGTYYASIASSFGNIIESDLNIRFALGHTLATTALPPIPIPSVITAPVNGPTNFVRPAIEAYGDVGVANADAVINLSAAGGFTVPAGGYSQVGLIANVDKTNGTFPNNVPFIISDIQLNIIRLE